MFRIAMISLFAGFSLVILSAQTDDTKAEVVSVTLSSFAFSPELIELKPETDYVLELTNSSSGGHSFGAPEFFEAVTIKAEQKALICKGRIEVPKGETVSLHFKTAGSGKYKLKCTHFLHNGFGMNGDIIIR